MPVIKIHRKSRLKTVNSSKSKELDIHHVIEEGGIESNELSTPGGNPNPKPYKPIDNDTNDLVGDYYHESFPEHLKGNQRIFIQIAAYRDNELLPTIKNMLDKADNPENLRFGICWQHHQYHQW